MSRSHFWLCVLALAFWGIVCVLSTPPTLVTHLWGQIGPEDEIIEQGNITTERKVLLGFYKVPGQAIYSYKPDNTSNAPIITAILVNDIPGKIEYGHQADVHIIKGGVNSTSVILQFTSRRGHGFHDEVKIYGRYNETVVVEIDEEQPEQPEAGANLV